MAAGIRLFHDTARSGTFTFEHHKRPYRVPLVCPACQRIHKVKTYHIAVDSGGFAFVSKEVWNMMRRHGASGFHVANEVATPPNQTVGMLPSALNIVSLDGKD